MKSPEQSENIEIFPPEKPLEWPLNLMQVATVLGINDRTLYFWIEKNQWDIPTSPQGRGKQFGPAHFKMVLDYAQNSKDFSGKLLWLRDIDLKDPKSYPLTTPTGYRITLPVLPDDGVV